MATRPILIADAEGHIVYEKQTTDNPKAADAHIRNAGYRRVGEWANGAATVELIPASAKLKKNCDRRGRPRPGHRRDFSVRRQILCASTGRSEQ